MNKYITPNYETISSIAKMNLTSLINSSLLNGFNEQDFDDVMAVLSRVCNRLSTMEKQTENSQKKVYR